MQFRTPEDYRSLLESIDSIKVTEKAPAKILTESKNSSQTNLFEAIGSYSTEIRMPDSKYFDTIELKFNLENN